MLQRYQSLRGASQIADTYKFVERVVKPSGLGLGLRTRPGQTISRYDYRNSSTSVLGSDKSSRDCLVEATCESSDHTHRRAA